MDEDTQPIPKPHLIVSVSSQTASAPEKNADDETDALDDFDMEIDEDEEYCPSTDTDEYSENSDAETRSLYMSKT